MTRSKGDISEEEAKEIAESIAREIVSQDQRYQAIAEKEGEFVLESEIARCGEVAAIVKDQIYHSIFRPTFFEKSFGKGRAASDREALTTIRPEGLYFTGRMDRVDLLTEGTEGKKLALAIDYKTGSNQATLEKTYSGVKIQLPLYLEVLAASGYEPVAALYASLKPPKRNAGPYLFGPKCGSGERMECLDDTIGKKRSPLTGLARADDGTISETMLLSKAAFAALRRYVVLLTEKAIREIRAGCVVPSSMKTGKDPLCKKCEIRTICRHAGELVRELPKKVTAENFVEISEKENCGGDR